MKNVIKLLEETVLREVLPLRGNWGQKSMQWLAYVRLAKLAQLTEQPHTSAKCKYINYRLNSWFMTIVMTV